jgi:hypothetical protein
MSCSEYGWLDPEAILPLDVVADAVGHRLAGAHDHLVVGGESTGRAADLEAPREEVVP